MKRELTIGTAAVLALGAVVGISTQSRPSRGGEPRPGVPPGGKSGHAQNAPVHVNRVCGDPESLIKNFLLAPDTEEAAPDSCYDSGKKPTEASRKPLQTRAEKLHFVIATLPDPLHTHFSLTFDRLIEAVQQAGLDAGFDYDSSWLPWETSEPSFTHLADQDASDDRKDDREDQPGIILFRKGNVFEQGLVVFVVGEEATRGIHRKQFQNAAAWIKALSPNIGSTSVGILGPSFSGSLPSLAQLLADRDVKNFLNYPATPPNEDNLHQLRVYSGQVTDKDSVEIFGDLAKSVPPKSKPNLKSSLTNWHIHFHSFVESDDAILREYCQYLTTIGLETPRWSSRVAIVSEDETAYGSSGGRDDNLGPCPHAVNVFYPRDISALRSAYQERSLFSSNAQSSAENPNRNLPSDLADPARETHDTIRSYSENQLAMAQEAQLLGIVGVLKDHRSEILIIRSSNVLDQIFLIHFFHRYYPEGRIAIRGADTLFLREHGSGGLSGVTTLSSYPLIPWDWRDWPNNWDREKWKVPTRPSHTHRVFGEEGVEGTYIAARFLLRETFPVEDVQAPLAGDSLSACSSNKPERCFLPPNLSAGFLIPDYKVPFWAVPRDVAELCTQDPTCELCQHYLRPAIWISVVGQGSFYPLFASAPDLSTYMCTGKSKPNPDHPLTDPRFVVPTGMRIFLCALLIFAGIHACWCWTASFTAKPAFRAHFAVIDNWFGKGNSWQHPTLITIASLIIAFSAVLVAWGCGALVSLTQSHIAGIWSFLIVALLLALAAVVANHQASQRLEHLVTSNGGRPSYFRIQWTTPLWGCVISWLVSILLFLGVPIFLEMTLTLENRLPTYWRSMNLTSGVCPLLPFLFLFAGIYLWFWNSLHGLALFGRDRPRLPGAALLRLTDEKRNPLDVLRMFSREDNAETETMALPMYSETFFWATIPFVVIAVLAYAAAGTGAANEIIDSAAFGLAAFAVGVDILAIISPSTKNSYAPGLAGRNIGLMALLGVMSGLSAYAIAFHSPIRSLGANRYAGVIFVLLNCCVSWMLAEAWQLLQVWLKLKRLLTFLDRLTLRRTMQALQGFSWGNVWKMSGNVLDVRYKLLSRQIETLNHLLAAGDEFLKTADSTLRSKSLAILDCRDEVAKTIQALQPFARKYAAGYADDNFSDFDTLEEFQQQIATVTGMLLTRLLIPAWHQETESLIHVDVKRTTEQSATDPQAELTHVPEHIRNAEELVCITYLGFAQNVLGRLRTIVLSCVGLSIATTLAVSTYPFDPRPGLNQALTMVFLAVGGIIIYVYADMHRDSTLSRVTNTTPGELGMDFWVRIAGFGIGPFLTLVAYLFPGLTDFVFSWLEPAGAAIR